MRIDLLSLFPEFFESPLRQGILSKAIAKGVLSVHRHDIREFGLGKWKQVDDVPFGGEGGMLLMAEPVVSAIRKVRTRDSKVIYLSPQGELLTAKKSRALAKCSHLVVLCGHYEGVDQRALDLEVDEEISIGDYVLMSGMVPALVLVESVARFVPGVLGNTESANKDSLEDGLLEGPQYTRPRDFLGEGVPDVLLNGDRREIERWRLEKRLSTTQDKRPDLYAKYLNASGSFVESVEFQPNYSEEDVVCFGSVVVGVRDVISVGKFYSKVFGKENLVFNSDFEAKISLKKGFSVILKSSVPPLGGSRLGLVFSDEASFLRCVNKWRSCLKASIEWDTSCNCFIARDPEGNSWTLVLDQEKKLRG
ncbi:tRNA (guanosine(37)-N1)-methyltransferase TrmD [Chlamydiifrater phoenicopteri]|uniref:tRNA (guanosine(37)-N1)-methyltransferase TrmD n=1 Tax=Chlamydiifrater phoenicopteri TaxID=2681469 RepID=UPI001BCE6EE5